MLSEILTTAAYCYDLPAIERLYPLERHKILNTQSGDPEAVDAAFIAALASIRDPSVLEDGRQLCSRFTWEMRQRMPATQSVLLKVAEGVIALQREVYDLAVRHLKRAADFAEDIGEPFLFALANYQLGRCKYKCGQVGEALSILTEARAVAPQPQNRTLTALIDIARAWIHFMCGRTEEAVKILRVAGKVVGQAGDYIEGCNILGFEARILRQQGKYWMALERYREAILLYEKRGNRRHVGYARSYAHMAFCLLLHCGDLETGRDRAAAATVGLLVKEAAACLEVAEKLARNHGYPRVGDRARLYHALLLHEFGRYLDPPAPEGAAAAEARSAYQLAKNNHDIAIMVYALTVMSMMAPEEDSAAALRDAQTAYQIAEKSDNRRAQIRARIWLARAYLRDAIHDYDEAVRLAKAARELIRCDKDYLLQELEDLECRLEAASRVPDRIVVDISRVAQLPPRGGLPSVVGEVEEEIVKLFIPRLGRNPRRLAEALHCDWRRIQRILDRLNWGAAEAEVGAPPNPEGGGNVLSTDV